MEQDSSSNNEQEQQIPPREPERLDNVEKTYDQALPQQLSLRDPAVQTQGGAFIGGNMINKGGVNVVGGQVETINYYESAPSPSPNQGCPNNHIPFPRNPLFQSRPDEFEELERLLFASGTGPKRLGLVGMGGIGKTQLAVELVYRSLDEERFPEGIFWLTATGNADDWRVALAKLALATNYLPMDDKPWEADNELRRAQYLCRYLASHSQALLVLDNVDDPGLVISVLPAMAGGQIVCSLLYTSRVTRAPSGITTYSVDKVPPEVALRLLLDSTRPTLLMEILQGSQGEEAQAARAMCEMVGYLPLALVHLRAVLNDDRDVSLTALLAALQEQGALEVANDLDPDEASLIATFRLSWEKVREADAQRLFKLAAYFPEATPIPLWLLGLAAGLGEKMEGFTPLGRMWIRLQQLSLLEKLSKDQIRLHPLVRAFGQRLVTEDGVKGQTLLREAAERLASEFTSVNKLEQRARNQGYWVCLEQVRVVRQYIKVLGATDQAEQVERIEHWLDHESYLLGDERWWPRTLPGLFYQQLYNRSIEEKDPLDRIDAPSQWLRQMREVGAEGLWLLRIFAGHGGWVNSVAFSPDGQLVLTGSDDGTARLWETSTGKQVGILKGHNNWVRSVAFSPDGQLVLTGLWVGTARLWETGSGKQVGILEGHYVTVNSVAFSPDGQLVLTGSGDKTARLWETGSGKQVGILEGHSDSVSSVAFSSDGQLVLTGSDDRTARLWETSTGKQVGILKGHSNQVNSVAFSPDSKLMLTGSHDRTARLWETGSGKQIGMLEGHSNWVTSVKFSPDGNLAITCDQQGMVYFWRVTSMERGKLVGLYVATYEVGALYWQDATHVVLADLGGPQFRSHFYYLKLEGLDS